MSLPKTHGSRYQAGTLEKRPTKDGPCWYLRFRLEDSEGHVTRPRVRIGLARDFSSKAAALRAADPIRVEFNERRAVPQAAHTINDAIAKYEREEMPARRSTAQGYSNLMHAHIAPRWGRYELATVRASEVREWLRSVPLSTKTRGHIRDMLRTLFRFAMLWEWIPLAENPMSLFRLEKSNTRTKQPNILSPEDFARLLTHPRMMREPVRTIVCLAAGLGLRRSELFGLKWKDVIWDAKLLRIERGYVDGHLDAVKTAHSRKPLPLHDTLALMLRSHLTRTQFRAPDDFIFASPHTAGEKPYDPKSLQHHEVTPAAHELGLGVVGWHTFRHSYRAWLGRIGAEMGVQKDLMRHANIGTTMNVYGDSFVESLRAANDSVVNLVIN